jgi:hypothetical protein
MHALYSLIEQVKAIIPTENDALLSRFNSIQTSVGFSKQKDIDNWYEALESLLQTEFPPPVTEDWKIKVIALLSNKSEQEVHLLYGKKYSVYDVIDMQRVFCLDDIVSYIRRNSENTDVLLEVVTAIRAASLYLTHVDFEDDNDAELIEYGFYEETGMQNKVGVWVAYRSHHPTQAVTVELFVDPESNNFQSVGAIIKREGNPKAHPAFSPTNELKLF